MNKQFSIILGVAFVIWLSILTIMTTGSSDRSNARSTVAIGDSSGVARIAYVHGDSIQLRYQFIQDKEQELIVVVEKAQKALERQARPLQEEAQKLLAEANSPGMPKGRQAKKLEQEAQELIDYANGPSATDQDRQVAENRLYEIQNELGQLQAQEMKEAESRLYEIEAQLAQLQNASQSELMQLEMSMQREISETLTTEVEAFAQENGLDLVLNWGLSGEGVLHGTDQYDVTESMLAFLNDRYSDKVEGQEDEVEAAEADETEAAEE